ncbi:unnamed protein product [marine sediment metagenome]|uniref:IgGFc-binding protein N-terminal domain-containing protein n=1 Tax=marine sediment metagenome TaxID=412755 RepID=X1L1C7_9ZZZZ
MSVVPFSVGTSEVRIVEVSPDRTSIVIINNHAAAVIYVRFKKGVAITNGMPVFSKATMSLSIPEDDPSTDVWCVSDTPATPVVVYEGFGK